MDQPKRDRLCIASPSLSVWLLPDVPSLERVRLADGGAGFNAPRFAPSVMLYDTAKDTLVAWGEPGLTVQYELESRGTSALAYRVSVSRDGEPAVAFQLSFTVWDHVVEVAFDDVVEHPPTQLVRVDLRGLVCVDAATPAARLVIPTHGGRIVDPAFCGSGERNHRYSWVEDPFCQVAAAYDGKTLALLRLTSLDDQVCSFVDGAADPPRAGLGVRFVHRYTHADPPYSGRHGIAPVPAAEAPRTGGAARSFVAHGRSSVTITVRPQDYPEPSRGWIQAAEMVRGDLRGKRCSLYRDRFVNKLFIGSPSHQRTMTFDAALDLIGRIHRRTGGARQVAYLVGFQHRGHDTGYPDVYTVNQAAGGREALLRLIREARTLGAVVSLHDNFDDAYRSSPAWDEEDIGVDSAGNLLRGGVWNNEQAYWISLPVYAARKSASRIRKTLATYPIEETYHLDVLTASVFRIDFRADAPRNRDDDCRARLAVVDQFAEHDVDVSSEACGLPFLGHIRYFWHHVRVPRPVYPGDRRVPFTAFIAHGRADYGEHVSGTHGILDALLYGSLGANDIDPSTPLKDVLDTYFLVYVPLNRLRDEEMVDYREDGTCKRVVYTSGSFVEVDFESQQYRAVVHGETLVEDGVAIVPWGNDGEHLLYRADATNLWPCTRSIPEAWSGRTSITAVPILDSGDGDPLDLSIVDGRLHASVEPGVAYRCR